MLAKSSKSNKNTSSKNIYRWTILSVNVDPKLIGGSLIRVGDTVYDGSVANRLERVRELAKDNTIREIRIATERFSADS